MGRYSFKEGWFLFWIAFIFTISKISNIESLKLESEATPFPGNIVIFFCGMLYMNVYIWQVEVMPISIRATSQGLAYVVCLLLSTVPLLVDRLLVDTGYKHFSDYMYAARYVCLLVINTLCLLACYILPETSGKQMPERVADSYTPPVRPHAPYPTLSMPPTPKSTQ